MILASVRASALGIPFVTGFKHAAATRLATQTVWVEARLRDGVTGYGEGCPREYVTAETVETARDFIRAHEAEWLQAIGDIRSLRDWTDRHRALIDAHPAAWTAVELALLDCIGKSSRRSVESLLGLPELSGTFQYTAVLGDAAPEQFEAQLARYRQVGFRAYKLKLAGQLERDRDKVRTLQDLGIPAEAVRADANNLFRDRREAEGHLAALGFPFRAIEEPLAAGDYEGLRQLATALDTRIILDESLLRASQLDLLGPSAPWIVNVRVSKMGGLLRSLEVIDAARRRGIPVILGAHVGETSLLTRAALTLAISARDVLAGQEGAFGTHLLAHDVVEPPIMFGRGGELSAAKMPSNGNGGFGLDVAAAVVTTSDREPR